MSSIRRFFTSIAYSSLFNLKLNRITRVYRQEVCKVFDLDEPHDSYWIECKKAYFGPPQVIESDDELFGSTKMQAKTITKNWQFFPDSIRRDLFGLLRYIVWMRKTNGSEKEPINHQNEVSDHVYEM